MKTFALMSLSHLRAGAKSMEGEGGALLGAEVRVLLSPPHSPAVTAAAASCNARRYFRPASASLIAEPK